MKWLRRKIGSIALVALSCVTVLGIAMAGFLAVSSQAMKFANRSYLAVVSKQLAENGLEQALRAYNANTFTTAAWTRPDSITANKTFTLPTTNYGNTGITATVNVRVYHYRDTRKATVWNALSTYAIGDYVWYQGVWYLCIAAATSSQPPYTTGNWKAAPDNWNAYANYQIGNIALFGGSAYRCIAANTNLAPSSTTSAYWTAYTVAAWNTATAYAVDTTVFFGGIAYRCIAADTGGHSPPNTTYWLSVPVIYAQGVATLPDNNSTTIKTELRATLAPAPLFPNALAASTLVTVTNSVTVNSYNGGSFNGTMGTYNQTSAPYSAASPNIGSSAVVAGGNTSGTAVAISASRINGYVAVPSSSNAPLYTYDATNGIITSTAAPTAPPTKIDLTRVSRSPYIPQFDVQSVTGAGNLPSAAGGTTYLNAGNNTLGTAGASSPSIYTIDGTYNSGWLYSGLYLSDTANILNIVGPVILNVNGPLYTYYGKIVISPTGSLEVYFSGQLYVGSTSYMGIQNQTNDPKKCLLVGTSTANSSGSHYYWPTGASFYGLIYMPNAYVSTWSNVVIYGAVSAKNIAFPQAGNQFHYDTSLRTAGSIGTFIDSVYRVSEWRELTDPNDLITLP